jgi:hypothetical protein
VGLVAKRDELYAKTSCDLVAGAVIEGERQLVGAECKARVMPGTHQQERIHYAFLSHFQSSMIMSMPTSISTSTPDAQPSTSTSFRGADQMYTVVRAASAEFNAYVDSSQEAVQLLHQAYVYSFNYVLLLVGDRMGNIIRGEHEMRHNHVPTFLKIKISSSCYLPFVLCRRLGSL